MRQFLLLALFLVSFGSKAQDLDSLLNAAKAGEQEPKEYVFATFKSHHVINFPTVETIGNQLLDLSINHRFGDFNTGANNFFGLDGPACIRIGLSYGITDRIMIGIGRSSLDKLIDGTAKFRLLRQTVGKGMPISVAYLATMNYTTQKDPNFASTGVDKYGFTSSRLSYGHNLIIGRKFGSKLSLEINGFYIHYNMVDRISDSNDMLAVGFSGRYKVTSRSAITFEYAHRVNKYSDDFNSYYDPMAIGMDIETGGHVFQFHFTNAFGINEAQYIPYTRSNPFKAGIRLGFNITRGFATSHKKKEKAW